MRLDIRADDAAVALQNDCRLSRDDLFKHNYLALSGGRGRGASHALTAAAARGRQIPRPSSAVERQRQVVAERRACSDRAAQRRKTIRATKSTP